MKTYVINLKNEDYRWKRTLKELKKVKIKPIRFEGINGNHKKYRNDLKLTKYCNFFCTDKMIGVGLSHLYLAEYIHKNDKEDYYLILEDDIKILNPKTFTKDLKKNIKILKEKNLDILLLFCQFLCNKNYGIYGSTAAYLISKNGIEKSINTKLNFHIDIIRNSKLYTIYNGDNLFGTYDPIYNFPLLNYRIGNQNIGYWLNQDIIRFYFNLKIGLLLLLGIIYFIFFFKFKNNIFNINIFLNIITFFFNWWILSNKFYKLL